MRHVKPTTAFRLGCLINFSINQLHTPSVSAFTLPCATCCFSGLCHSHSSHITPLLMLHFRANNSSTVKLLAALGKHPRTSTSFPWRFWLSQRLLLGMRIVFSHLDWLAFSPVSYMLPFESIKSHDRLSLSICRLPANLTSA